jgi:hypothetical protein
MKPIKEQLEESARKIAKKFVKDLRKARGFNIKFSNTFKCLKRGAGSVGIVKDKVIVLMNGDKTEFNIDDL